MPLLLNMLIIGVWASTMIIHTRRLLKLACVAQLRCWGKDRLRTGLHRVWWWLGQDEFWRPAQSDTMRSIEVTLLIFLIAWGSYF